MTLYYLLHMKDIDPFERLEAHVGQFDTLTAAAASLGITKQYLSDILRNHRDITPRVLGKLGLTRVIVKERATS